MSDSDNIDCLPPEVLKQIFTFLPCLSLIAARKTSTKWRSVITEEMLATTLKFVVADASHTLHDDEVDLATELISSRYLATEARTTISARIESSLSNCSRAAVVRCASSLAASGHLTSVGWMWLRDLELPNDHLPALASVVWGSVWLHNVTGDLANLLANLSCLRVCLYNMQLDEAATRGLVLGLQQGVTRLVLRAGARVHLETLLDYDGNGRCGEVRCSGDTKDIYLEEVRGWATRVDWEFVEDGNGGIQMYKR